MESQYLQVLKRVLETGNYYNDRTGVGCVGTMGEQIRFDMSEGFPLLTTKRTFLRGVMEELAMFVEGKTDARILQKVGVKIWDGNTSRKALDERGLTDYYEGDMGPIYGFQWRHFGARYRTALSDYEGEGVDQLKWVIEELRKNPTSRRAIMSAWNPMALDEMVLPPCHVLYHFMLKRGRLHLSMYQRSGDLFLGIPFNLASCGLLMMLIAAELGVEAGECVLTIGDAHIYKTHIEAVKQQLAREPRPLPILHFHETPTLENFPSILRTGFREMKIGENTLLNDKSTSSPKKVTLFSILKNIVIPSQDNSEEEPKVEPLVHLYDYNPHPAIKAPMAV